MTRPADDTASAERPASRGRPGADKLGAVGYNRRFDSTHSKEPEIMEAERINALSALLNDLTSRESELRRYL
jgi:hypothetical protein